MRIRSTKPEFWRSERIASVSWDARLVLKGLESYVDDNGVGKDDLALIVADVFPRDLSRNPTGTLRKVSEALDHLSNAGLLWRYDVDGTSLLYVAFWESIQRIEKPTRGRFRRPDGTINYRESTIGPSLPEPSRNVPGTLRPGTGDQGNRGSVEEHSSSPASPSTETAAEASAEQVSELWSERDRERTRERDRERYVEFDEWWSLYPRKVGKGQAMKAFRRARRTVAADVLFAATRRFATDPNLPETQFIPHPTTWLNRAGWDDEPLPARSDATVTALRPRPGASVWDKPARGDEPA